MPAKKSARQATDALTTDNTAVVTTQESTPEAPVKTAKKTTKKDKTAMTATPENSIIIDSGVITDPAQLDSIKILETNVRNWDSYRLEVEEIELESPGEEFPRKAHNITINAGEVIPEIGQLWQSLFTKNEETGEYSYKVNVPLVLVLNEDGSKTPISGNSRSYLAQQVKALTESGKFPYPVRYEIPYIVREGMTAAETALAQINTNNGVSLTLYEQYDVLSMLAEGDVERFRDIANSIYPRYNGQGNRFARFYEKSLNGFPVSNARLFIPNLDTALQVFTDWEKLAKDYPTLATVCPKAEINLNCNDVSGGHNFTKKDLPALEFLWKTRLVESGVVIPGFGETGDAEKETKETEEKFYPPVGDVWGSISEAYNVAFAAVDSCAYLTEDENTQGELAKLAAQLQRTLTKFNDLLHHKAASEPKAEPTPKAEKTEKEPKAKKTKKAPSTEPVAPTNDAPAPLSPEAMQQLADNYEKMVASTPESPTEAETATIVERFAHKDAEVADFDSAISQLDL